MRVRTFLTCVGIFLLAAFVIPLLPFRVEAQPSHGGTITRVRPVVDGNIVIYDGTTGFFIEDSGASILSLTNGLATTNWVISLDYATVTELATAINLSHEATTNWVTTNFQSKVDGNAEGDLLRWDGGAWVVMPQVNFMVSITTNYPIVSQVFYEVTYDNVITNVGGGWNPATQMFTAPVNGTYTFGASWRWQGSAASEILAANLTMTGGTPLPSSGLSQVFSQSPGGIQGQSVAGTYYMTTNQSMNLRLYKGTTPGVIEANVIQFYGHLIGR